MARFGNPFGMLAGCLCAAALLACVTMRAGAQDDFATAPPGAAPPQPNRAGESSICLMIESAARAHGLPPDYFARVIWQESRFDAGAVGPLTRSGRRAQGIAQFMPGTAAERRLLDPFDPVQALPKSAEFLAELRQDFGNLGLAAAAYNAGPRRVRDWLAGTSALPGETRAYVSAITGITADEWIGKGDRVPASEPAKGCADMMAMLRRAPNPFVAELEQRVIDTVTSPWGVQLAAGFSKGRALESYARVMARYRAVLGEHDPLLMSTLLRSRGTRAFYQVRAGAETRAAADTLCGQMRRAGGSCMVLRNRRG